VTIAYVVSAYKNPGHQFVGSSCLFARKFDPAVGREILDLIDDGLLR
jgi:hypothetical protein